MMGVAIKKNVPVVCCAETQADAAESFSFDQGEPTKVKGRLLPLKVCIACNSNVQRCETLR